MTAADVRLYACERSASARATVRWASVEGLEQMMDMRVRCGRPMEGSLSRWMERGGEERGGERGYIVNMKTSIDIMKHGEVW